MKLACLILCFCSCSVVVISQESVNTGGSEASGSGGIVSYSVGQAIYVYQSGTNGNINQGVQQPYEIHSVGVNEMTLDIDISLYPNPTIGMLTLQINDYNNEKLSYQLYDFNGKRVNYGKIITRQTKINIANLPSSTYFMTVVSIKNNIIQSFKIIKN